MKDDWPLDGSLENGWLDLLSVHYGPETRNRPPEERSFAGCVLPKLDGVLSCYARHNRFVLDSIPKERLLILRTEDIAHSREHLARALVPSIERMAEAITGLAESRTQGYSLLDYYKDISCGSVGRE